MHLYNLTLEHASSITSAAVGNFSGLRQQEILISKGTRLQLLKPDPALGKLSTVLVHDVFGSIRSLAAFRLTGGTKDYAIVGSDSGRIVILEYDPKQNIFVKLYQETYGKTGARRIVPGQMLATDPKGRSVMISAMEKAKLVYVLNRDAAANLTISSPLEAHKPSAIIHHIIGVDVGFENPLYAALEVDYAEADNDPSGEAYRTAQKMLTFYELDLGLNHVVRKWSEPTDPRANLLVQVPGGQTTSGDPPTVRIDGPSGVLSEIGDLYKVTLEHQDEDVVALKIKYFDTVSPAISLCILKSGHLFVPSEFGNHYFYQFQKLGDDDQEAEYSSADYPGNGMRTPSQPLPRAYFRPRPLENLVLLDELESLDPILSAKVQNLPDASLFYAACGRGARSTFRTLKHGLEVDENGNSDLPSIPNAVWTLKLTEEDQYDSYIVLSFVNGTLVLSFGEEIEEIQNSGFLSSEPTLAAQQLGQDALLQVHPRGIRHILSDKRINEWRTPQGLTIVAATTNKRQVVLALSSAELIYFELDYEGQLNEYQDRRAMGSTVLALSIGGVPEGLQRFKYLAVGCEDQTVRIISLDPDSTLEMISLQAVTAPPSSISIADMHDSSIDKHRPTTFVNIGLQNGVLLRTILDPTNGKLADTRTRFLGNRPVRLIRTQVHGSPGVLALSSRSWLNYTYQGLVHFTPLAYDRLDGACSVNAELCPDGFIGIAGATLRIFQVSKLGSKLKQEILPLSYTPRKFVSHPQNSYFYLIESDHRTMSESVIQDRIKEMSNEKVDREVLELDSKVFGNLHASEGIWASCIRIVDPVNSQSVAVYPLDANEAAFSIAVVPFSARNGETLLVVGTAVDVHLTPRSCSAGYLRVYSFADGGSKLELLHKTEADDVPMSLLAFQGRLVAGVGKALRLYDIGKKKLLRKAENRQFASAIVTLNTQGSRILAGDLNQSVYFVVYKAAENRLLIFADDVSARWTTAATMLDYNTVVGGDKFGNVFVNRLNEAVSKQVDDDPTGAGILHEKSVLMGAPHKTKMIAHFHVGDIIMSMEKVALVAGARDSIVYFGLHGTIGILTPLVSKDDVDFISTLEQHMRTENLSLVGRDHLSWRGYYTPVKAVVDGDLCEYFAKLPTQKQLAIAGELDRTVGDVLKKLESLRVTASGF
ncbi:pre-mRNA-splicing factor rse1 [Serendipita sp. 399]|nr:pre-mRNA-splicing factor rse1 [Serendipita sp. 399]